MNELAAQQVLDGALLSDGGLFLQHPKGNAYFYISQSGGKHVDWLLHIREALLALGVAVSQRYPKTVPRMSSFGKQYEHCYLNSRVSPLLTEYYHRWYPRRQKIVPENLHLTPIIIANWFMGDGSTYWVTDNLVTVMLCTESFDQPSHLKLVEALEEVDITGVNLSYDGHHLPVLKIHRTAMVSRFLDMVEPHVLLSYRYKIKKPWRAF